MRNLILIVFICLLVGCTNRPANNMLASTPDEAAATQETVIPEVAIPEPGEGTGNVIGSIVAESSGAALVGVVVYLGEILPLDPGDDYLVTLGEQASPHAPIGENGSFLIEDVVPGEYPIVIWTPMKSVVVPAQGGESELRVIVSAGKTTDLGEISVDWR